MRIIDLLEIVEIDEEQRKRTHGAKCQRAKLGQRFLEVGMIVEAGQTVADGLVTQELIGLHEVSIRVGQSFDESFRFHLLALGRR